jgi:anti-sigma factor RsiW
MKDARFKELLNLHLDHRLSPVEAEELESALREDPARRKALRDYEAMQSACAALFTRSETRAPSSAALCRALRQAENRMEHPRSLKDAWGWPTWGLTGGLAACVALVVARLSQPALVTAKAPSSLPGQEGESDIAVVTTAPALPEGSVVRTGLPSQITFAALGINPQGANADAASRWILQADETAVFATIEEASAAGETMQAWNAPVAQPASPTHFHSRPINAWGRAGTPVSAQLENVAYRFER